MDYGVLGWTNWQAMPSPETCRQILGPSGPGVYQICNKNNKQLIQFGIGGKCKNRMQSIYPKPYGTGNRNNEDKRIFILGNWSELEYRTLETETREEAYKIESIMKSYKNHLFNT